MRGDRRPAVLAHVWVGWTAGDGSERYAGRHSVWHQQQSRSGPAPGVRRNWPVRPSAAGGRQPSDVNVPGMKRAFTSFSVSRGSCTRGMPGHLSPLRKPVLSDEVWWPTLCPTSGMSGETPATLGGRDVRMGRGGEGEGPLVPSACQHIPSDHR